MEGGLAENLLNSASRGLQFPLDLRLGQDIQPCVGMRVGSDGVAFGMKTHDLFG